MRKVLTLIVMLLSMTHLYGAQIFNLADGIISEGKPEMPERVIESFGSYIEVTYNFHSYGVEMEADGSVRFSVPLFTQCSEPGLPEYLFKLDNLNVDAIDNGTVEIIEAEFDDFNLCLSAAHPHQVMGEETSGEVPPINQYQGFYPNSPIQHLESFNHRGQDVVSIQVSPLAYSIETQTVRLYKTIKYRITVGTAMPLQVRTSNTSESKEMTVDYDFDINHDSPSKIAIRPGTSTNVTRGMLIFTIPSYVENLKPFIEWKKTLGIPVKLKVQEGWGKTEIFSTVAKELYRDNSLYYVLLVGNQKQVPGEFFNVTRNPYDKNDTLIKCPTDFRYSTSSINQNYPVLMRGRFPVNTPDELKTVVDKIIQYEKNPITEPSFYSKGVHMAYIDTNSANPYDSTCYYNNPNDNAGFVPASEEIYRYITTNSDIKIDRLYSYRKAAKFFPGTTRWCSYYNYEDIPDSLSFNNPIWGHGGEDFVNCINSGILYGLYLGHGNWDCFYNGSWYGQKNFDLQDVNNLHNGNRLPFIFAATCLTANFNRENLASKMLSKRDGGCIAYYGASGVFGLSDVEEIAMLLTHYLWNNGTFTTKKKSARSLYQEGHINTALAPLQLNYPLRAGEILNGVIQYQVEIRNTEDSRSIHLMGDPSMYLRINPPTKLTDVSIKYNDGALKVDLPNTIQNIVFYDTKKDSTECWLGTTASYHTTNPSNVKVCVYGPSIIPYISQKYYLTADTIPSYPVNPGITINCINSPTNTIEVEIQGEQDYSTITLTVTNMTTFSQKNYTVEPGLRRKLISVPETGNYIVTLIGDREVVESKKILVSQ